MAEEIDENDFFQRDFTTASEWELFNARLEEIFHDWQLPYAEIGKPLDSKELFRVEWNVESQVIFFADVELEVKRYRAVIPSATKITEKEISDVEITTPSQVHVDLISLGNNFNIYDTAAGKIHPLAVWYGLRDFVIIEPTGLPITNESQFRVLLSSACITVAESNTEVPVFIHVMPNDHHVYLGVSETLSLRTSFDIVALDTIPPTCKYLSGLLCMFKGKIGVHYVDPVTVSVRLSYSLANFINVEYRPERRSPFSNDAEEEIDEDQLEESSQFYVLPYGVYVDPVGEIILNCTWPNISENVIVDSPTYSDLDPLLAPIWSIRANFKQRPVYFLTETCSEYLKLSEIEKTLSSIVGSSYDFNQYLEGGNPLDLLTESKIPSISSVISGRSGKGGPSSELKQSKPGKSEGPLSEDDLMRMLYYMFPDAQSNAPHPYNFQTEAFDPLKIKSAEPDSLVFRLSMLLTICNSDFGGISGVAHLWAEFTQEMRYRVERCIQIPGVSSDFPDSRTSLLHQKLQMLNVCIERRRIREGGLPFSMTPLKASKSHKEDSEEEQFYDCSNDEEHDTIHPAWNKPEGRLSRLGMLTLIDSSEPLYIPITQQAVPKTEDQLEEDAEVMLKLGPGSELCTQMMSASLLSDMESFKAANPSGKLEDFIRWYSPRDWVEESNDDGDVKGRLSQRMLIPGNTWQTVWKTAKPVPARRQKRLFDDTKEVEKALHFFETRTIGQICQLTIAPLFHAIVLKVREEINKTDFAEAFEEHLDKVVVNLCKLSRESWCSVSSQVSSRKKWESLLQDILHLEEMNIQSMSLVQKLFGTVHKKLNTLQVSIIMSLLKGIEAELDGASLNPLSLQLLNMSGEAKLVRNGSVMEVEGNSQKVLPDPFKKEYTLRVSGKTIDDKKAGPQFLRAILGKNLRLCGAFTANTTYL